MLPEELTKLAGEAGDTMIYVTIYLNIVFPYLVSLS